MSTIDIQELISEATTGMTAPEKAAKNAIILDFALSESLRIMSPEQRDELIDSLRAKAISMMKGEFAA